MHEGTKTLYAYVQVYMDDWLTKFQNVIIINII